MKRHFPIVSSGQGDGSPNKKRPGPWHNPPPSSSSASPAPAPLKFMSWNVNSLMRRLTKDGGADWRGFRALVMHERPDIIALQEVMLRARQGADVRRRVKMDEGSPEFQQLQATITSMGFNFLLSLADSKRAGTLVMVREELLPAVRMSRFNFPGVEPTYEEEGRVILLEFDEFDVLATYAPNHGYDATSFERRRRWDAKTLAFVQERTKPLVWLGDLNVSHLDLDVSHPSFFASQKKGQPPQDYKGQPGYTPIERRRFGELLQRGRLVDAYRALHPVGPQPSDADWTWRGAPVATGIYHAKGMRIDYTLVSRSLLAPSHNLRIARAEVLGRGAECIGFFGSDHCPILLELERSPQPEQAAVAAAPAAAAPVPSPVPSPSSVVTAATAAASASAAVTEGGGVGAMGGAENGGGGKQGGGEKEGMVDLTGDN
jgi:exodeoxyribonuclease III